MNDNIRWYSLTEEFETQDNEIVTYEKSCEIVDQYLENQKYIKEKAENNDHVSGEEAVAKSMFGFYIDGNKNTFLQIDMDSSEKFRVKFEYDGDSKKFLFLTFGLYQKEYFIEDIGELKKVIKNFYEKDLIEFKNYFNDLPFKVDRRDTF